MEKAGNFAVPDRISSIRAMLAAILMAGAGIGVLSGLSGVFIKAVCEETGISRASFSLIGSIATLVSAFAAPFSAHILSGRHIRAAVMSGAVVCGAVPVLYSLSDKLWKFWLAALLNGLFLNFVTMLSAGILLSRAYPSKSTAAVGAAFAAPGLFTSAATPLAKAVVDSAGWRCAWALTGLAAAVMLAAASLLIPKSLPSGENEPKGNKRLYNRPDAASSAAIFIVNFCNLALFNHAIPFLTDIGYGERTAVIISQATALMALARIAAGFVYSRLGAQVGTRILSLSLITCAMCALNLPNARALPLYVFTLAAASTASALPAKALATDRRGNVDKARYADLTRFASLGSALGAPVAGAAFDMAESYRPMWLLCLFLAAVSLWLFTLYAKNAKKKR